MTTQITLPPNTRRVFQADPAGDMDLVVTALMAMGAVTWVTPSGDTTGATDSANIAAAMAALPATGGTVNFTAGNFYNNTAIVPAVSGVRLRGQGPNCTVIWAANGANCDGYQFDVSQAVSLIFCSIEGITFNGNYNSGSGNTSGYGCHINYSLTYTFWDFYLRDVWFENWANDGFYSTGGHGYVLDHVLAEYNGGNGINFAGGFVDSPPRIVNGTIKLNGADGVIMNCVDGYVGHNEISNNSGSYGLVLSASGVKAAGNQVTDNSGSGVHVTGGSEGIGVTGNTISYNAVHGMLLDDANTAVTGNFFLSNSYAAKGGTTGAADELNIAHGTFSAAGNQIVGNVFDCASSSRYGINFAAASDTAGVAVANKIVNPVTAPVNTAAPDTMIFDYSGFTMGGSRALDLSVLLAPSGATAETYSRTLNSQYTSALTSEQTYVSAIPLPAGLTVSDLAVIIGSTGFTGVSHGWLALLDSGRVVRAVTADQTSAFGSANTPLSLAAAAPYVTTYAGCYYLMACVTATGMGTLAIGNQALSGSVSAAPVLAGTSSASQTTPPATGTTMGAITPAGSWRFYGYTS